MRQLLSYLEKLKPLTDLGLTACSILIAVLLVFVTCNSDRTFHREAELLSKAMGVVENEKVHLAREAFNKALDEADSYCNECQTCAPQFGILTPIDKAVLREAELSDVLTAAEYNRLAILGSSTWEFEKTKGFALKALNKSLTPIDKFMSNVVLGHLYFVNYKTDNDPGSLRKGRDYFQSSIKAVDDHNSTDAFRYYLGQAHALWATHERVVKNTEECQRHYILAKAHWEGLGGYNNYIRQLDAQLSDADSGHLPNIACLFHLASPPACVGAAPSLAPALPGAIPSPARFPPAPKAPQAPEAPKAGTLPSAEMPPAPRRTFDIAIDNYTEAIRRNPKFPDNYYGRAFYYGQKAEAEFDIAIADYTEAIRLNPKYVDAYNGRGHAYSQKQEFDKALKDFQEVEKLRHDEAEKLRRKPS